MHLAIAVLIYMTFDATRMGNGQQYGILKDYLLINDDGEHIGDTSGGLVLNVT